MIVQENNMQGLVQNNSAPLQATGPDPDTNPAYQAAIELAMKALYGEKAAKQVAQTLRKAPDVAEGLANTTYDIVSILDERTQGKVPDELLVLLASTVLEEVADIADAAGLEVTPAVIAVAMKTMILRYLGEQGVDTAQLQAAMDKIDPAAFNGIDAK